MPFELPKPDEHTTVIGRTGSGKTQLGAWILSKSDYHARPHYVFDWKREKLFNSIAKAHRLKPGTALPTDPGLYILPFMPDDETLDDTCWQIYHNENACVLVDEGSMIDRFSQPFRALMTQGRSKNINLINLTQRPANCAREVFSEASHLCVFQMNDDRDKKIIQGFTNLDLEPILPQYHSHWYNAKSGENYNLLPAPEVDSILERFEKRLPEKPKRFF